jgi:AAA+ ATPase superfamily predicted ATPase
MEAHLKMLNSSLKYIVLVVINIIVLYVFISEDSELDGVIFDVTYVLDLLDSNKILEHKSIELNKENVKFSESIDDYKRLVSQTDLDLKISKTDLTYCDSQKNDLIELSERQAIERRKNRGEQQFSQMQCSDNLLKLELVNLQIQDLQKHIKLLNDENMATTSRVI